MVAAIRLLGLCHPVRWPGAVDISNHGFGMHAHPDFVLDTLRQGEKVGQRQIRDVGR